MSGNPWNDVRGPWAERYKLLAQWVHLQAPEVGDEDQPALPPPVVVTHEGPFTERSGLVVQEVPYHPDPSMAYVDLTVVQDEDLSRLVEFPEDYRYDVEVYPEDGFVGAKAFLAAYKTVHVNNEEQARAVVRALANTFGQRVIEGL